MENDVVGQLCDVVGKLEGHEKGVVGIAVATVFEDGSIGSSYVGTTYVGLLGAMSVLRSRIEQQFEDGPPEVT